MSSAAHAAPTAGPVVAAGRRRCGHFIIGGTLILDNDRRTLGSIVVGYLIVLGTQGHLDTLGCLIVSGIEGHFDHCIGCLIVSGYNDTLC